VPGARFPDVEKAAAAISSAALTIPTPFNKTLLLRYSLIRLSVQPANRNKVALMSIN
jgi:hypothetical protein